MLSLIGAVVPNVLFIPDIYVVAFSCDNIVMQYSVLFVTKYVRPTGNLNFKRSSIVMPKLVEKANYYYDI